MRYRNGMESNESEKDGQSTESETTCPVCGGQLTAEKCKVVCRSEKCVYRIVFNCSEF